jgi:hypothetical protein
MKIICFFLLFSMQIFAQNTLSLDIDNDKTKDIVSFDKESGIITCKLSSQKFAITKSKQIDYAGDKVEIEATKTGFAFSENWMRAGYSCQFRYNNKLKKIQLIGMSRYEFGNAANDGSGESSINLITNDYIGKWNYYDEKKQELVTIPTIKRKMIFSKTFLEDFDQTQQEIYSGKCSDLFGEMKNKMMNPKKKAKK